MAWDSPTKLLVVGGSLALAALVGLGAYKVLQRQRSGQPAAATAYAHVRGTAEIGGEEVSFVVLQEIAAEDCPTAVEGLFGQILGAQKAWETSVANGGGECLEAPPPRYEGIFSGGRLPSPYVAYVKAEARTQRQVRVVVWAGNEEAAYRACRQLEADLEQRLGVIAKTVRP